MLYGITTDRVSQWLTGSTDASELTGMAASPGVAEGIARIVSSPDDLDQLQPGDVRALVVLDMPAKPRVELGEPRRHVVEVGVQHRAVDDQRRRHHVVAIAADRRPVEVHDAIVGVGDERRGGTHVGCPPGLGLADRATASCRGP